MDFTFFWEHKKKDDKGKWKPSASLEKLPLVEPQDNLGTVQTTGSSTDTLYSQDLLSGMKEHYRNAAILVNKNRPVPDDKVFYMADGRVLKSLSELENALKTMSMDIFAHHVNQSRNDFANWVRDVMKHQALADELQRHNTRESASRVLESLR